MRGVAIALVALGFCLGAPAAAHATVFNVIPSDGVDAPVDTFTDQDELWAYTTADISGGLACVVPRPFLATEEELVPVNCGTSKAWGVSFIPGGTSGIWPISQMSDGLPSDLPFESDCSVEVTLGCEWEIGIDGTTTRSVPFTITRCSAFQCPTRLVPSASSLFKAGKTTAKAALETLCTGFNMLSVAQATADAKEYADLLVAEGASAGVVFTRMEMFKEVGTDYAINLFKKLLTPPGVKLVGSAWASASGFILCAPGLDQTFGKILDDPPDSNYTTVAEPEYDDLPPPGDALGADLVTALDHLNGDSMALLHGYERYQGADADGSEPNVHRQARAMSESGFDVLADTRQSIALLRSVATRSESDPDIRNQLFSGDDFDVFDATLDRVRTSGFTADEIGRFHDAGLTDDEIALLRERYSRDVSASGLTSDSTLADALRGLADGLEPTLEPTEAFARNASAVAGETNQPPAASFTAEPAAPDSRELDFASTSTSNDGDSLTVRWDFGDGATDSGANAAHTYDTAGTYTVTQTVTDGFESDTTTKSVTAGHVNQPPKATFTATPSSGHVPLHVEFDASGSSDPDGSVAAYHWVFGDGGEGDGAKVSHDYVASGSFQAQLVVTDDAGLTDVHTATIAVTDGNHAPEPVDDALAAEGAGALDVLENDADPDKDALRVVATGAPAHGTASCSALGGCLYTPTAGYAGPDSFTYRVADPEGLEATANVAVEVTTAPAPSSILARADHAATRQGTPVTVHVLANDSGTGLHLTDSTDPAHGTVACEDDGDCVYTPSAGYSGDDGFSYTVANADADQRSADVEIAVAPSTAGYGVTVGGAPAAAGKAGLVEGQGASWGAAVAPAPAGVTDEALAALPLPAVTAELGGAHALKPSSVRTARGWTAEPVTAGARTLHAKAGSDALLGEVSDAIPRPLPAIGQGTGGDGHVPILVGSKVFAFFHHSNPTQVTCVDRATGSLCPGYPKTLNQATTNIPGPAVVVGTRIYVHLSPMQFAAQRTAQALYCWDTAKNRTCGLIIVDRPERQYAYASAPVRIGGKMYFGGDGGRLYCVDPATNASCAVASLPTGLGADANEYDIVAHGSRVYLGRLDGLAACIDVAAGGPCPGWALPRQFAGPNLVTHHSAAGVADGVCSIGGGAGQCYTDSAPATAIPVTGWPGTEDYYSVTAEAEIGKRTLMAAHGHGGLGCWDWATMAPCTGGDYVDGWIDHDTQAEALPMAYGAAYDGSCVVGLGDPGLIFTVDPAGHAPCTSLGAGTEPRTIDLRDQRCDNTVGGATWREVALTDSAPGELAAVTVTVRDAATGALLATKDIAGSKLDLSGIDPKAHPAITVAANAISTSGDPAWADSVPPRIRVAWKADPRQLCFETTTKVACASPLAPIGVTASIDGSAAKDEETLDVVRGACPAKPTPTPTPNTGGTLGNTQQSSAADLVRACTSRGVVLEDVIPAGSRVKLLGVAEERFKGRRVDIVFAATGKVVARPKVGADGSFSATAPMPPRRLRFSNRARYQARVGGERSLNLKLMRRMLVTSVRTSAGKVTIAGKVVGPLALRAKDREIVLERRVTCTRLATVSRFKPRSNGAFKVTVPVPAGTTAAVYRLRTKVRASTHGSRLSSTFTLPRAIGFR